MNILVTGGKGFIGSHVVNGLAAEGHQVLCIDIADGPVPVRINKDNISFVKGDVTNPLDIYDACIDFGPERIVHLASLLGNDCEADPRKALEVNVLGSMNVFDIASQLDVDRVVAASSAAVYNNVSRDIKEITENLPRQPNGIYGLTKLVIEDIGQHYQDRGAFEFAALEPVHAFGPDRVSGNAEDSLLIKGAVDGFSIDVSGLKNSYEVVYVRDEARAFVTATLSNAFSFDRYLVSSGRMATLQEILSIADKIIPNSSIKMGKSTMTTPDPNARPPANSSRIRDDLDWTPHYGLEEAVHDYVNWLIENPSAWSVSESEIELALSTNS